jgi:1-acyl-sn-glycerol-3-phosphate acyltransferase
MTQQTISLPKASLKTYVGSTLFLIFVVLTTPIFGISALLCYPLPFSVRYRIGEIWISQVLAALRATCDLKYEVEGLENLPTNTPAIILSNHQSAWETIALRNFIRPQTAVLKKSLLYIPFGGWALATLKPIAIDRQNQKEALKMLIEQGTQRLQEGLYVLIFPEGTRVAPGKKVKFNAGGSMLAQKSSFPVIPLAHNAGIFWPRNSFLKYPGTIRVKIGPVIDTNGKKSKEINQQVEEWIDNALSEML